MSMASQLRNLSIRALSQSRNFISPSSSLPRSTSVPGPRISLLPPSLRLPASVTLTQRSTMATQSQPEKMEWLVVIPDFPGAHEKRLEVRPQHFANLGPHKESGLFQMGGAVLNEVPTSLSDPSTFSFAGSTIVMRASSREEIKEVLRKDVYATSGVWDVENAQMWPFLCAFRNHK